MQERKGIFFAAFLKAASKRAQSISLLDVMPSERGLREAKGNRTSVVAEDLKLRL